MSWRRGFVFAVGVCLVAALTVVCADRPSLAVPTILGIAAISGVALLWRIIQQITTLKNRTLWSLLNQYLAIRLLIRLGKRQRAKLEKDTLDVWRAQEETLLRRLHLNADTAYGREFEFSSIEDIEEFRQRHPITTYDNYKDLVERVAAGDNKVLTSEKPIALAGSSGTSNMLLITKETKTEFFLQGMAVCTDAMMKCYPDFPAGLQRTLKFVYSQTSSLLHSNADVPAKTDSSLSFDKRMLHLYTSPAAVFQVQDTKDALYLHLLFGLKDRNIGAVESHFCSDVFYAFRTLEECWTDLVDDIELGRVSPKLALGTGVRASLEKLTTPNPDRALELRACFAEGFEGVARRVWPQLHLVMAIDSGSEQIYGELLRQHYCRNVPFYSPLYATTEGLIGVNLWPGDERRRYLLCPRSMFCEFLPEESLDDDRVTALLMDQVKEGTNYELIVTNAAGLYRYRTGDVVKVVKFHNQCPVVEFLYRSVDGATILKFQYHFRRSQTLNVRGEKVSEDLFLLALKEAVAQWPGAKLADYCCVESSILGDLSGGAQPHYLVFLELKGLRNLNEEQRYKLDRCLQAESAVYKSFRIRGSIGPMRVQLVSAGTFQELKSRMTSFYNASLNTFITPRVIHRKQYAEFLLGKSIS